MQSAVSSSIIIICPLQWWGECIVLHVLRGIKISQACSDILKIISYADVDDYQNSPEDKPISLGKSF